MSDEPVAFLPPMWSDVSPDEAAQYEAEIVPRYASLVSQALVAEIPNGTRGRILDVGCGTGNPSLSILKRLGEGGQVVGVDPSASMLDVARARALDQLGRRVFYKRERADQLKFGDEVFDIVVSSLTERVLPDYAVALKEMRRVLRSGGQFHIAEATVGSLSEIYDALREVLVRDDREDLFFEVDKLEGRHLAPSKLEARFDEAGFRSTRVQTDAFKLSYRNADELFADRLIDWLCFHDLTTRTTLTTVVPNLLSRAKEVLAIYHERGALSVTVQATVLSALR